MRCRWSCAMKLILAWAHKALYLVFSFHPICIWNSSFENYQLNKRLKLIRPKPYKIIFLSRWNKVFCHFSDTHLSAFDNGLPPLSFNSFQLCSLHLVMINIKTTEKRLKNLFESLDNVFDGRGRRGKGHGRRKEILK